ncbi:MAG: SusC/RagA family TonB-linked outer membrane protein [Gemmatimonadaceae bacterium]|nr:SusC/RagA family TonB-linked outer membrane protein [Gemmatimonadaceae bacterium]
MRFHRLPMLGIAVLLVLGARTTHAQTGTISGNVTEQSSTTPIPQAEIVVQGLNIGAVADAQGRFTVAKVPAGTHTVVARRLGYVMGQAQVVVTANGSVTANFSLARAAVKLDQIVSIGYGTADRRNVMGAVEQVNAEQLAERPVPNLTLGLQGMLPGVNIRPQDGKPIQAPSINVRGTTSIGTGGSALVLIDGVEGDPSILNPDDVQSVTVLKDASAAAVYGARGAFGVMLITTKRPQKDQLQINYGVTYGNRTPVQRTEIVTDGYTFARLFDQAFQSWQGFAPQNVNKTLVFSASYLDSLRVRSQNGRTPETIVGADGAYQYFNSTNWYDHLYRSSAPTAEHNLSISRGTENAQFLLSGRLLGQDGMFRYNTDDFSQKNLRADGSIKATDWLNVRSGFMYSNRKYHNPENVGEGGAIWRNLQDEGHVLSSLFNPDGTLTHSAAYTVGDFVYGRNGIDFDSDVYRTNVEAASRFFGDRLKINSDVTYQRTTEDRERRRVPVPFSRRPGVIEYVGAATNTLNETHATTDYLATNTYGEYNTTFGGKHSLRAMGGVNYEERTWNQLIAERNGLIFPDASDLNLALGTATVIGGGYEKWNILGGFTRLNYSYGDRYMLEFTGRYDGSSKFPEDQRYAFFPSTSASWRISQEPFWKVPRGLVNDLRLSVSHGSMGNGNGGAYQFQQTFNIAQSGVIVNGVRPQQTSVPAVLPDGLTWETATTTNFGLDADMIDNRFNLSFDLYTRKTTDMFTTAITPPAVFGASAPRGNYADLKTNGWELAAGWQDGFRLAGSRATYGIRVNVSDNTSEILKYNNPNNLLSDYRVGQKVGEIWGYTTLGFFADSADIMSHANQSFIQSRNSRVWLPGDIKFKDINGDGKIDVGNQTLANPGDLSVIGNSTPRYSFGLNLNGAWRSVSIGAFFQGVGKQSWHPNPEADYFWGAYNRPYNNIPSWHLEPGVIWDPANPRADAFFPRLNGYAAQGGERQMSRPQTKYMMNVAYIRLKNLQVGYDLPKGWLSRIGASRAKVYVSGENLWTHSPLYKFVKNVDVENISQGSDRILTGGGNGDGLNYPMMRTFVTGMTLTF